MQPNNYQSLLAQLYQPPKRKVFVSYHHKDQIWVDSFRKQYSGIYEVFTDCSLDEAIDSSNLQYINRTIREDYITGTSITLVLCGSETWKRKCVDWEIYSTLWKDHALLGIMLPTLKPIVQNNQSVRQVPDRLYTNIMSGYAQWMEWPQNSQQLKQAIDIAIQSGSVNKKMKDNSAQKMARNL